MIMLAHCFATLPMKRTAQPTVSKSANHNIPQKQIDSLAVLRGAVLHDFDRVNDCYTDATSMFRTEEVRAEFLKELEQKVQAYEGALQTAVNQCHGFSTSIFFFWQASVTEKLNHAFDDHRVEISALHFNCGAILMNFAASILANTTPMHQAGFEKEAYGLLSLAAGHFELAETIVKAVATSPRGTATSAMTEDSKPAFLQFLKLVALGQAQEIGLSKMLANETNKHKEINAKLCRRVTDLYREASAVLSKQVNTSAPLVVDGFAPYVSIKINCFDSLAHYLTASSRVDAAMPQALRLVVLADERLHLALQHRQKIGESKLPFAIGASVTSIQKLGESCGYRINQINSLVMRQKISEDGAIDLPAAQELARVKAVVLTVTETTPVVEAVTSLMPGGQVPDSVLGAK